jgi:hypothetical protein
VTIVYPGTPETPAFDEFFVTTLPEDTPLAQAGPGANRNLPELAQDLGDAVELLQRGTSYRDHDHSGDPEHIRKGSKLKQANTHEEPDTDQAVTSIHHTIDPTGTNPLKAAAADHFHDYNGDKILNVPYKICTSITRPGMPHMGMTIYETDTRCWRQWGQLQNDLVVAGVNQLFDFNIASVLKIGGDGWVQGYATDDDDHGIMATPNGFLTWLDNSGWNNSSWARWTGENSTTLTDDQVWTWRTGGTMIEETLPLTQPASNDFYFRVSEDEQSYIRVMIGNDGARVRYTTSGRANEKTLGSTSNIDTDLYIANTEWRAQVVDREIQIYRAGRLLFTVRDNDNVTAKGENNRGYMIGMRVGERFFGQTTPSQIDWARMQDLRYYTSTNRWIILPIHAIPTVRLRQSKAQKLFGSGTMIEFTEELEDDFGFFNKAASLTDVVVKEPGLYRIEPALQWDPQFAPDQAHLVVLVNGLETTIRDSKFIRGSGFTPGFSQTLSLSGLIRLAEGDVVTLKARYTAPNNIIDKIFSFFDQNSRVNSRFDLTYVRPY